MTQVPAAGATDVGQRDHNEDAFFIDAQLGLMMVADGVGGHEAGAVASSITCDVISREVAAGGFPARCYSPRQSRGDGGGRAESR